MRHLQLLVIALCSLMVHAQKDQGIYLSGSIQSNILIPQTDESIGAEKTEDLLNNTYAELMLQSKWVDAGARLEYLEHPLPGYENDFKGWGVPHFWLRSSLGKVDLTVGTFYEQFGSGFILRFYEDRSLGIDNSLLGARVVVKPVTGMTLKALGGRQRRYWQWNKALISGVDGEINFEDFFNTLQQHHTHLTVGASWVNKYDNSDYRIFVSPVYRVNFPKFVNAWDIRLNLNQGPWSVLAEYAQKSADPSLDNEYIFKKGTAAMLSGSYARKGVSILLQAKRSENMSFKSSNDLSCSIGTSSAINHMPAFTQDHTYALAALYPYATQLAAGEWAYQAEVGYQFKRRSVLGGRYGMNLKLNYSYVRAIDKQYCEESDIFERTNGYTSSFFKWGDETYYQDLDITLTRKFSKTFRLSLMYMNQRYNQQVVEGHGDMIHSDIFVADAKYQFSPTMILRGEMQYLSTKEDQGDWLFGLLELSMVPHWMITISDMWNHGESKTHYYQGLVTCNYRGHRFQAGYGRTRAGYNCSGGVCRYVPATKGFTIAYNYNF